jgi:mRNA interferase MazF
VTNALQKKSAIDCYQLRALSHQRFLEKLGQISPAEMDAVKKAVALILDIEPEQCT